MTAKEPYKQDPVNTALNLIPKLALGGAAGSAALIASPLLSAVLPILTPLLLGIKDTLAERRVYEVLNELNQRLGELDQNTLRSEDFASFFGRAMTDYVQESSKEKREMLRRCILNNAISWDSMHNHSRVLEAIKIITPGQYRALVDIAKAIERAMEWDMENHGKLTFEYGIGVIKHQLEGLGNQLHSKALLREVTLDVTLRELSSMNLVRTKDTSIPTLGGAASELSIISLGPLGFQMLQYITPEVLAENLASTQRGQ